MTASSTCPQQLEELRVVESEDYEQRGVGENGMWRLGNALQRKRID